jgi:hypothetical protein
MAFFCSFGIFTASKTLSALCFPLVFYSFILFYSFIYFWHIDYHENRLFRRRTWTEERYIILVLLLLLLLLLLSYSYRREWGDKNTWHAHSINFIIILRLLVFLGFFSFCVHSILCTFGHARVHTRTQRAQDHAVMQSMPIPMPLDR